MDEQDPAGQVPHSELEQGQLGTRLPVTMAKSHNGAVLHLLGDTNPESDAQAWLLNMEEVERLSPLHST